MILYNEYLEQAKLVHQNEKKWTGTTVRQYIPEINQIRKDKKIVTMLDYGCGKAQHHDATWGAYKYDPAIPEFEQKPATTFDLVISTDVLEHIPYEDLPMVIRDIFSYANKWVFISVCCREAREILPNGMNAHATVMSQKAWKDLFIGYENYTLRFSQ